MVVGAIAIMVVAVFAVRGTNLAGNFTDAPGVARALEHHAYWMGALFAIVLLDASIIGASAVTLSTSYAFGDVFGIKHSLHRSSVTPGSSTPPTPSRSYWPRPSCSSPTLRSG